MDRPSFGNCLLSIGAFGMGPALGVALNPDELSFNHRRRPPQATWSEAAAGHAVGTGPSMVPFRWPFSSRSSSLLSTRTRCVRRNRGRDRGRVEAPLRRSAIRRDVDGVLPVYRRSIGTASGTQDEFVAEIKADGVACHIGASMSMPGLLPRRLDSRSYESGQNAGEGCRRDESGI